MSGQQQFRRWTRFIADPTARVRSRLTREGYQFVFLLMFSLTAAIIQNVNLLILLAGSLAGILLIQWRLCSRTLHRISIQRNIPGLIEARRPFNVELTVHNPKRWLGAWWLIVTEKIRSKRATARGNQDSQSLLVNIEQVTPNSYSNVILECQCDRRGEYSFWRTELSTRFPLSLMRGIRELDNAESFLVHPAFGQLDKNWWETLELPRMGEQQRRLSVSGGDGEFFGLREYRPGDPMRMIHWRSSARRDHLVVKQYERQENHEVAILVDLSEPQAEADVQKSSKLNSASRENLMNAAEVSLELAITMTREILRIHSGDVNLSIADGKPNNFFRATSLGLLAPMLNRLAVGSVTKSSQFISVMERSLQTSSPRSPLIVISMRSREESGIDHTPAFEESSQRIQSLRWINVMAKDYQTYFRRVNAHEE